MVPLERWRLDGYIDVLKYSTAITFSSPKALSLVVRFSKDWRCQGLEQWSYEDEELTVGKFKLRGAQPCIKIVYICHIPLLRLVPVKRGTAGDRSTARIMTLQINEQNQSEGCEWRATSVYWIVLHIYSLAFDGANTKNSRCDGTRNYANSDLKKTRSSPLESYSSGDSISFFQKSFIRFCYRCGSMLATASQRFNSAPKHRTFNQCKGEHNNTTTPSFLKHQKHSLCEFPGYLNHQVAFCAFPVPITTATRWSVSPEGPIFAWLLITLLWSFSYSPILSTTPTARDIVCSSASVARADLQIVIFRPRARLQG